MPESVTETTASDAFVCTMIVVRRSASTDRVRQEVRDHLLDAVDIDERPHVRRAPEVTLCFFSDGWMRSTAS